jgi:hypothetical protein
VREPVAEGLAARRRRRRVTRLIEPPARFLLQLAGKEAGKTSRRAVIEKNQHPGGDLAVTRGFVERTRHKRHEAF